LQLGRGLRQVKTGHYSRRRRREFLDFMNEVVADHPDGELQVVFGQSQYPQAKTDGWLRRHPESIFITPPLCFLAESSGVLV